MGRVKALMHEFGEQGVSNQNWAMGLKRMSHTWTVRFFSFGWMPLGSPCLNHVCRRLMLGFSRPRLMRGHGLEQAFGKHLLFEDTACVKGRGGKPFARLVSGAHSRGGGLG